ncbi:unnamed protein product [Meloidogyne enterolobii]|uniref:Uncharacterized protein n=1 Tax=Meloidogyne enterolobii TaxID=390850 RepID=A0ACB0XRP7_MELEN
MVWVLYRKLSTEINICKCRVCKGRICKCLIFNCRANIICKCRVCKSVNWKFCSALSWGVPITNIFLNELMFRVVDVKGVDVQVCEEG